MVLQSHISLAKRLCDKYNAEVPGSAHILGARGE